MTSDQIAEQPQNLLQTAGILVLVSAALHVVGYVFSGFSGEALSMIPIAVVAAAIGWALMRGWERLAWIAFVGALAGVIIAYASTGGSSPVPDWVLWLILLADLSAVGTLFLHIWRR